MNINNDSSNQEKISVALKKSGMRMTPQRLAIGQYLAKTKAHPTAADVYNELKPIYPSLSLMTVYNTLNALVGVGAVNALGMAGDDIVHYDGDTSPHVNLICLKCHRISDMDSNLAEKLDNEISTSSGFKVIGSRLVYYGLCPDCQKSKTIKEKNSNGNESTPHHTHAAHRR